MDGVVDGSAYRLKPGEKAEISLSAHGTLWLRAAGWQSYGRNKLDTDVLDFHNYTSLYGAWTGMPDVFRKIQTGLEEIYGSDFPQASDVFVSSPHVPDPVAVRYAFRKNPQGANLYNREGLPASPFRTDSWE